MLAVNASVHYLVPADTDEESLHSSIEWLSLTPCDDDDDVNPDDGGAVNPTVQLCGEYEYVVDPGLRNILKVHVYRNGQHVATYQFSCKQYYQESQLNYASARWLVWNNGARMKALNNGRGVHHFKTSDMTRLVENTQHYSAHRPENYQVKLSPKKFARLNFFIYNRQKCQNTVTAWLYFFV